MYQVLDKDTIKMEILLHLSLAKRGYSIKSQWVEIVNAILYKLKTGVQWEYLPVKSLFSDEVAYQVRKSKKTTNTFLALSSAFTIFASV